MKKFRNYILASVGFAMLACTISLTAVGRAAAEKVVSEAVRVYNTETQPLFVKTVGTVPVRGDVHVSGGGVSVNNVPSEPVSNRAILFAMDIFDESLDFKIADEVKTKKVLVTVPVGKTLKLESISGMATFSDLTTHLNPLIEVIKNNVPVGFFIIQHPPLGAPKDIWVLPHQSMLIYAKAGDTVEVSFDTRDLADNVIEAQVHLHFAGTYFDTP